MPGRRYSDGLPWCARSKRTFESRKRDSGISIHHIPNYFRLYEKLSGMTGTADTEAVEISKYMQLRCCVVPTNKPLIRKR